MANTMILCFQIHHFFCIALPPFDVLLWVSLQLLYLDIALQYYTGVDASRLWFVDSVAGQ